MEAVILSVEENVKEWKLIVLFNFIRKLVDDAILLRFW